LTEWLRLGHGPFVLRSLSSLAVIGIVPLLYDAARRLIGAPAGCLAGLLFVLDPNCVFWAQKARPYALQGFFVAILFWGFVNIWLAPPRDRRTGAWFAYALGGALAVLTQYPAAFFVLGCDVAIAGRMLYSPEARRCLSGRWIVAHIIMMMIFLLWLPGFLDQAAAHLTPERIAQRHRGFLITGQGLERALVDLLSVPTLWRAQTFFTPVFAGAALAGTWTLLRRRNGFAVLAPVFVPLSVCLTGWAIIHPVLGYITYSFMWLLIPYPILLAAGVEWLPRRLGSTVFATLMLGDLWGLRNYYAVPTVPIDQVAAAIKQDLQPGDGLLLSATQAARWGIAYYLGPPYTDRPTGLQVLDPRQQDWPIQDREQALRETRMWIVVPRGETAVVDPATLAPTMTRGLHMDLGSISLERYDTVAPPPDDR
jgi:uncharacterized membrane protein